MTIESHPLIGVDYSGAHHQYEKREHNKQRAAHALLKENTDLARVYDGRQKKSKHQFNKDYGKLLAYRPGQEPNSTETTLTTFSQLGESLTEAQTQQLADRAKTAHMIIDALERKGATLYLREEPDNTTIMIAPQKIANEADRQDLEEHHDTIIIALKERAKAQETAEPKPEMNGKAEKKTQRAIFCEHILPHVSKGDANFIAYDVERLLHKAGYHDIADDGQKVTAMIYDAIKQNLVVRTARGSFHVLDEVAKRFAPPAEATPEPAAPPAPPQPPEPAPVAAPEAALPALTTPLPRPEGLQKLLENLSLAMATSLVELPDVEHLYRAASQYQDTILQAGEVFLSQVKDFTSQVQQMRQMKDALRDNLMCTSTNTTT